MFSLSLLPKVNMPYFGLLDTLAKLVTGSLLSLFRYLFDLIKEPLGAIIMSVGVPVINAVWDFLIRQVNYFFYNIFVVLLFVLDVCAYAFDIFVGLQPIYIRGGDGSWSPGSLLNFIFFSGSTVTRAFWGIAVLASVLTVAFAIFAIIRSMGDLGVRRPVGRIVGLAAKSMITFMLIPAVTIASLNLSSTLLMATADAISGKSAEGGRTSIGTNIYASVIQDAVRTKVPTAQEMADEVFVRLFIDTAVGVVTNPAMLLGTAINQVMTAIYAAAGMVYDAGYESSASSITEVEALLSAPFQEQSAVAAEAYEQQEVPAGLFKQLRQIEAIVKSRGLIIGTEKADQAFRDLTAEYYMNGARLNNAKKSDVLVAELTSIMGLGYMPYMDSSFNAQMLKLERVHSFVGIICVIAIAVFMVMASYIFIRRILEIVLLYLASPYFAATIALDDGEKFKAWRGAFISAMISGFGIIVSMKIYLLLIPIFLTKTIRFSTLSFADDLIRLILVVAGAASVMKAYRLVSQIVNPGSLSGSAETDAGAIGSRGFSLVTRPLTFAPSFVHSTVEHGKSKLMNKTFGMATSMVMKPAADAVTKYSRRSKNYQSADIQGSGENSGEGSVRNKTNWQKSEEFNGSGLKGSDSSVSYGKQITLEAYDGRQPDAAAKLTYIKDGGGKEYAVTTDGKRYELHKDNRRDAPGTDGKSHMKENEDKPIEAGTKLKIVSDKDGKQYAVTQDGKRYPVRREDASFVMQPYSGVPNSVIVKDAKKQHGIKPESPFEKYNEKIPLKARHHVKKF